MTDRQHEDDNFKVRAIVDDAIAELLLMGLNSRDQAAQLMAYQAVLRIQDNEIMKEVRCFVDESIWDVDDTDEEGAGG